MRSITSALRAALTAGECWPRFFVEAEIDGSTLRYWTGHHDISWDGHTWLGSGLLKHIGNVSESGGAEANGWTVGLAGEPSAIVSISLQSLFTNYVGKLWLGLVDSSNAVISDPFLLFEGLLDSAELNDNLEEASLVLSYESKLIAMNKVNEFRYNAETQKTFYPADTGFRYMEALEDWIGYWGRRRKKKRKKSG